MLRLAGRPLAMTSVSVIWDPIVDHRSWLRRVVRLRSRGHSRYTLDGRSRSQADVVCMLCVETSATADCKSWWRSGSSGHKALTYALNAWGLYIWSHDPCGGSATSNLRPDCSWPAKKITLWTSHRCQSRCSDQRVCPTTFADSHIPSSGLDIIWRNTTNSSPVRRLAGGASHGKPLWEAKGADANHPVQKINKQPFLYRFCATGIGASMWFFVSRPSEFEERSRRIDTISNAGRRLSLRVGSRLQCDAHMGCDEKDSMLTSLVNS